MAMEEKKRIEERARDNRPREEPAEEGESNLFDPKDGKSKRRALCWEHFMLVVEDNVTTGVVCKLCDLSSTPIPWSGNTVKTDEKAEQKSSGVVPGASGGSATIIPAMLPQVSQERRDHLHKMVALWIVRCKRPLSIGDSDRELRDIFECIFQGGYNLPGYTTVVQKILELSQDGKERVRDEIIGLLKEGILPSIAGDIWSQGGIAIFGILVYWIDAQFKFHEKLVAAIPFSEVRYNIFTYSYITRILC
ncbi:hypothetical protein CYMTET_20886 [Cymbomonas tetramitiformis]|uniref:Uncharacterized protein n=1 Tax=Cymbomonas tetramitiformis TaxID=36881 RepID=A0AAE0G346_9CHLO|nr:hypothetical protein CYMTET_20886 [Cymbomonas tetramitiformis]